MDIENKSDIPERKLQHRLQHDSLPKIHEHRTKTTERRWWGGNEQKSKLRKHRRNRQEK